MFSLKISKKLPLEKCVCLLWKVFGSLVPCVKTKNDVLFCLRIWSHYAQIWLKGEDIKIPPLFYLVCLRSFGALSGWAYPQYRQGDLFMIMEHRCGDISDHE